MSVVGDNDPAAKSSFSFRHGRTTPQLRSGPFPQPGTTIYVDTTPHFEQERAILPPNWMAEADAERQRHGYNPAHVHRFSHRLYPANDVVDEYDEESEQDGDVEGETSMIENTPSRSRILPEQKPATKPSQEDLKKSIKFEEQAKPPDARHSKSLSDIAPATVAGPLLRKTIHRFNVGKFYKTNSESEPFQQPAMTMHAPQPQRPQVQLPPFSSKVSSLHEESSDAEEPLPPQMPVSPRPATKRPLPTQDLDFDLEDLKIKTMTDLDGIPFTSDPRLPATEPPLDLNGQPLPLPSKLTNLTKMRAEDQTKLFRSLTDTEREQTAEWFLNEFRSDMQKLMEVRVERRKIALKYEMEVKKRERRVQVKKGDVEEELVGLRKGGAELVRGKSPVK